MEPKVWYQSKTILVNLLVIVAIIGEFLLSQHDMGLLPFTLDPLWVTFILGVVNIILRAVTNGPVSLKRVNWNS